MSQEKQLAEAILKNVGGAVNTNKIYNCMTRVRVDIKDFEKVNKSVIHNIAEVLGVVQDGQTLQIVVGPGLAQKVASEMNLISGSETTEQIDENLDPELTSNRQEAATIAQKNKEDYKQKEKTSKFKQVTASIASIFVPLIPAFVGAGLIGGVASVLQNLITAGSISGDTWNQIVLVLNLIKGGLFGYLNIYIGINAAKVFGATEGLGGILGGLIYLAGMTEDMPLMNIFTGEPLLPGQGGVIGVLIAVYLLSLIEKSLRKVVPNSLDIIITPAVSLLIMGLITIFLIMPIAGWLSSALVGIVDWVLGVGGAFSGFILGATFLPLVMFGLHQILTPIHIQMIDATGSTQLLPVLAMAGAGQVGAALALWVKARHNKKLVNVIKGALPVGILGIGEPLIYAVTLPLGKPFITACLGGGIGGAVIGWIGGIGASAIGPSGVALIPLIVNNKWLGYVAGLLAAYIGGFILTFLFGTPKDIQKETQLEKGTTTEANPFL